MESWLSKISKWTPGLTSANFRGTPGQKVKVKELFTKPRKNRGLIDMAPAVDILITSYETLFSDIKWFRKLCGDTWSWTRVTDSTTSQSEHRLF
jgi:SWI/SNF-related matrix-associated actin-dependent regulator of chromatin subfamily A member 5